MIKRKLFSSFIISLALVVSFVYTGGKAFAYTFHTPDNPGHATITITDKNTGSNYAYATGVVGKFLKGGYEPSSDDFFVTGAVDMSVHNGQKIEVFIPEGSEQGTFIVTVHTLYVSKNEPTTPSQPSQPSQPSKPKTTTTKPKSSNPTHTTQTSNSSGHTSSSESNHKSSNNNTHSSGSKTNHSSSNKSEPKRIIVKTDNNGSDSNKNTSGTKPVTHTQNKSLGKTKPYTFEELKDKGAKVIKEDGRYFAVVDGKKQEITEDEAKKLGYKEDNQDNGNQGTVNNKDQKNDNNDQVSKNESKISAPKVAGVVVGSAAVVTGGTVGALYYFGHPGTRELIQKIIDFLLKWRK